ncbi:hypothetical protein ACG2LH_06950 [Zhouia sp. PK063]|uniref:hypothetical protein n=1 Tax=Zhouia sp. PK063 TaxID=3373602 RepID=UPI0037BD2E0F
MELAKIEALLEKYFEAATTIEEEKQLAKYFAQDNVAPHLLEYQPLFTYFTQAKEEQFTKHVPLSTRKKYNLKWISVAAVAVLTFGVYFSINNKPFNLGGNQQQLTQTEAQKHEALLAYQQTKQALMLLSKNLNKGKENMAYLNEFEDAKEKIFTKN